jgi:uncharacterized protein (DUF2252 family)
MANINERIHALNEGRAEELLEIKYTVMSENLFRFFRGTCAIFYEDFFKAEVPVSSPSMWTCGDLHLENFGSYKGNNRLVYFDLNDFDDAILAPAHWEIVRLLTSIFVAFDSLDIEKKKAEKLSSLFLKTYADTLKKGKARYIEMQTAVGIVAEFLEQAGQKKHKEIIQKRTKKSGKGLGLLLLDNKHLPIEANLKEHLIFHMQNWLLKDGNSPYNYKITDAAFRIAGTGSIGLDRYVFLIKSTNNEGAKFMLLDMKEAAPSCLAPYVKIAQPSWPSEAARVLEIQKRMQNNPPAWLSTTRFQDMDYIVQELQPEKDSIDFKLLKPRYRDMCRVVNDMGVLTASAQLRSSGRQGSAIADELIEFGNRDDWQKPLLDYAESYAITVKKYFREFTAGLSRLSKNNQTNQVAKASSDR